MKLLLILLGCVIGVVIGLPLAWLLRRQVAKEDSDPNDSDFLGC